MKEGLLRREDAFCVWTHLFSDLQGSLAQRLRLLVLPSLPVQDSQIIEGGGNLTGAQQHLKS